MDHHEIEDDGPPPELDPTVEARVRALLASASATEPMPAQISQRLESALADEVALRVDRGPLTQLDHDRAVLDPLIRQRQRPRPLFAIAAVAAAAAVVAVGGSALHLSKNANGTASLSNPSAVVSSQAPIELNPRVQRSGTSYTAAQLAEQARDLLDGPSAPLTALAGDVAGLGPIATDAGLESCLLAQGIPGDLPVRVDLADYEGQPAAIIVVTTADSSTVRVVARTCQEGNPETMRDPIPVP